MAKIAIVTSDILGPIKNGGIGSAFFYLASMLSKIHDVTIFLCPVDGVECVDFSVWISYYKNLNIELILLDEKDKSEFIGLKKAILSYKAYQKLKALNFDIIHFPDYVGLGFYFCAAKKSGIDFLSTALVVHLHGNTKWHLEGSGVGLSTIDDFEANFLEMESIRNADFVVSPSKYMAEWVGKKGWTDASKIKVIHHAPVPNASIGPWQNLSSVSFVGRIEDRKGIDLFLDAIPEMNSELEINIIGKLGNLLGENSKKYLEEKIKTSGRAVKLVTIADSFDVQKILARRDSLIVIPSRMENSPCIIHECVAFGSPFITLDVGGTSEHLVPDENFFKVIPLVANEFPNAALLSQEINSFVSSYKITEKNQYRNSTADSTIANWNNFHNSIMSSREDAKSNIVDDVASTISVCIPTKDRSQMLKDCLDSFKKQTYKNFEILILDCSKDPDEIAKNRNLTLNENAVTYFEAPGLTPSSARNKLVEKSKNKLICFFDDDNKANVNFLDTLVIAMKSTDADVVTCAYELEDEGRQPQRLETWIPMGQCLNLAPFYNIFGDTACLIKKEAFLKSGGFDLEVDYGEDWDLYWRLGLMGVKHQIVPIPLFKYRIHSTNRSLQLIGKGLGNQPTKRFFSRLDSKFSEFIEAAYFLNRPVMPSAFERNNLGSGSAYHSLIDSDKELPAILNHLDLSYTFLDGGILFKSQNGDPQIVFSIDSIDFSPSRLVVKIYADKNASLQIYYLSDLDQGFSEDRVLSLQVNDGWNNLEFFLPPNIILEKIRLDFGSEEGYFYISDFGFLIDESQGGKDIDPIDVKFFSHFLSQIDEGFKNISTEGLEFHNVEKYDNSVPEKILITPSSSDPFFYVESIVPQKFSHWRFSINTKSSGQFQIFYSFYTKELMSEERTVRVNLKTGDNHFEIKIFSKEFIKYWKIDPININCPIEIVKMQLKSF